MKAVEFSLDCDVVCVCVCCRTADLAVVGIPAGTVKGGAVAFNGKAVNIGHLGSDSKGSVRETNKKRAHASNPRKRGASPLLISAR